MVHERVLNPVDIFLSLIFNKHFNISLRLSLEAKALSIHNYNIVLHFKLGVS
jgi:hypothetical protein